jgi:hypothetical protein
VANISVRLTITTICRGSRGIRDWRLNEVGFGGKRQHSRDKLASDH